MAKNALDAKVEQIDLDIARLQDIRAFLLDGATAPTEDAPKKPRKKRQARGLPQQDGGL